ncbi:MAG: hypothetical protein HC881_08230 [Leptolyngbyaceae cyanobacterium SL_7_1]|nr:hypothetical protein [Leptolyngbyaceae cyanobacterium SL_7_1]
MVAPQLHPSQSLNLMKRYLQLSVLFGLAIGCALFLSFPLRAQPPLTPPNSPPLSVLQFDPQRFKAALDRAEVADAIQQLEVGWKQQFDDYYQRRLTARLLSPQQIAQTLTHIGDRTGKRSALVYAISVPDQLEVILLLPNGQLIHHREPQASPDVVEETTRALRAGLVNVTARRGITCPLLSNSTSG